MHGTFPADPSRRRGGAARLVLRLAMRELRAGLAGFGIFIGCIALGVAAIAGVSSVARSLIEGVASQSRTIIGGDAAFALVQREASPAERAFLTARGAVSSIATLRGMAQAADGAALVEVKAVDAAYPTAGAVATDPPGAVADLLSERGGVYGAVADPALFARLGLAPGARVTIGTAREGDAVVDLGRRRGAEVVRRQVEERHPVAAKQDFVVAGLAAQVHDGPHPVVAREMLRALRREAPADRERVGDPAQVGSPVRHDDLPDVLVRAGPHTPEGAAQCLDNPCTHG